MSVKESFYNKLSKEKISIDDLLKNVSEEKIEIIKKKIKSGEIDKDYLERNPFEILYNNFNYQFLTLNDIKDNIKLDTFNKIKSYIEASEDSMFDDDNIYSYYSEEEYVRELDKKIGIYERKPYKLANMSDEKYKSEIRTYISIHKGRKDLNNVYNTETGMIYSQRKYDNEKCIYKKFRKLMNAHNPLCDVNLENKGLDAEQILAVKTMLESDSNLQLLLGDGGTGKSTVIKMMIKSIIEKYPDKKIAVLTATGKATSNLLSNYAGDVKVTTIHNMIGWPVRMNLNKFISDIRSTDIFVIDECSMISYDVLYYLLLNVDCNKSKMIFTGDDKQLLAVGPGYLVDDLMYIGVHPLYLRRDYRIQNLQLKNNIDFIKRLYINKEGVDTNKEWYGLDNNSCFEIRIYSEEELNAHIYNSYSSNINIEDINKRIILTHDNNKRNELNRLIQEIRNVGNEESYNGFYKNDKIIITNNRYIETDVFKYMNGQIGMADVKGIDENGEYLNVNLENNITRKVRKEQISDIDLGYALTIYKSQGSQWDEVDIILNNNYSEALSLNEFYTAVSRTKKKVTIWTTKEYLLKQLMKERDCRNTFIPLFHDKYKNTYIGTHLD